MTLNSKKTGLVVPLYNSSIFIDDLINSIVGQTMPLNSIVFVDDCSVDNTVEIMKEKIKLLNELNIDSVLIKNKKNMGVSNASNVGLAELEADILFYSGHDDIWVTNRVQKTIEFFNENEMIKFIHSPFQMFGEINGLVDCSLTPEDTSVEMLSSNRIGGITVALNMKDIGKNNIYFNSRFNGAEDYDLWTDLIINGILPFSLDTVLMNYRTTKTQYSRNFDYKETNILDKIQKKYFSIIFPESLMPLRVILSNLTKIKIVDLQSVRVNSETYKALSYAKEVLVDADNKYRKIYDNIQKRIDFILNNNLK